MHHVIDEGHHLHKGERRTAPGGGGGGGGCVCMDTYPLPVRMPAYSFLNRLYWPNRKPTSRGLTPMSPAGTSVSFPICLWSSVMKAWQNLQQREMPIDSFAEHLLLPGLASAETQGWNNRQHKTKGMQRCKADACHALLCKPHDVSFGVYL